MRMCLAPSGSCSPPDCRGPAPAAPAAPAAPVGDGDIQ